MLKKSSCQAKHLSYLPRDSTGQACSIEQLASPAHIGKVFKKARRYCLIFFFLFSFGFSVLISDFVFISPFSVKRVVY